jgi:hypothetical protein
LDDEGALLKAELEAESAAAALDMLRTMPKSGPGH